MATSTSSENPVNTSANASSNTPTNSNSNNDSGITLRFLCSFIKPYDGDRSKIHSFIRNCDNAMKLANDCQKAPLFNFICSRLNDKAELAIANHDYQNWEQLKEFLLLSYTEKKSYGHLQLELQTCRQNFNEDITTYMQRIETCQVKLLQLARTLSENENELNGRFAVIRDTALHTFIINCLPQYSLILRSRDPQTLAEAYDIAIREEKIRKFQNTNKFSNKFNNNETKHYYNKNKPGQSSNSSNNENSNNDKSSAKPKAIFMQKKVCKYCKKPGHLIDNCFKLQNKNKGGKRNENNSDTNGPGTSDNKVMNLNVEQTGLTAELRSLDLMKAENQN